MQTNYVDLIFTALDDQPLATSQHILVTAMSRTRQYGAQFSTDGSRITAIGGEPLMMEPVQATITLKNGTVVSVDVLDVYGVPTGRQVAASGNTFTIDGRYATVYYQINWSNTVIDNTPPTVEVGSVPAVTWRNLGRRLYSFTVHYSDNVLLDADSIDGDEVRVTGPAGLLAVQLVNKVISSNGKTVDATYSFVPPGGKWSVDDAGVYTVAVLADSFADEAGNANLAADLGTIPVTLPGPTALALVVNGTPNADTISDHAHRQRLYEERQWDGLQLCREQRPLDSGQWLGRQ